MKISICPKCERSIPQHLIQPMLVNGRHEYVCPVCALEMINHLHMLPDSEPFRGPIARANFVEACEYIKSSGQNLSKDMCKAEKSSRRVGI